MKKCLITKLKGSVDNNSLLKLGEMRIKVSEDSSNTPSRHKIALTFYEDTVLSIIGNGYFTNDSLSANNGKSISVKANVQTELYVSNGNFEISIPNKYALTYLRIYPSYISVNIEDLKYSSELTNITITETPSYGDISALRNLTKLTHIGAFVCNEIYGDISALSNLIGLTTLGLNGTKVSGDISALSNLTSLINLDISNTNISGDISVLSSLTGLIAFDATNTSVSGNISALSNLIGLTRFAIPGTNISGDISALQSLTSLQTIIASSNLSGDLSKLPSSVYYLSFKQSTNNTFTWTSRQTTANIFAIDGKPKINNIDKMLQDFAVCKTAIPSSAQSWYKTITATGTRTSASDAAVQTLQSKGYTVSITPA